MSQNNSKEGPLLSIAQAEALKKAAAHVSILIVDDSEDNRFLLQYYLKKSGLNDALEASNASEALKMAQQKTFDLLFLDLQLPDQDGFSVLSEFLKLKGLTKYVAFTADVSTNNRDKVRRAGFDYFLSKPLYNKELTTILTHSILGE